MPRHIRTAIPAETDRTAVVARLVEEINTPHAMGQPIILEDGNLSGDSLRVQVIWDKWEELPGELRSAIILDAYATALGDSFRQKIKFALGMTVPEAVDVGLLPFQVVPARRQGDQPSAQAHRKALLDAGASSLFAEDRPQLRFASFEDAEAAIEYLQEALPNSKWIVTREVSHAHAADSLLRTV